jgi:poly[(R)-3-hydroxyalkanoate] polymerase subunit PhaC
MPNQEPNSQQQKTPYPHTDECGVLHPEEKSTPGSLSFDRFLHAVEGRLSLSISPVGLALAWLDWGLHLLNAPGKRVELGEKALRKNMKFFIYMLNSMGESDACPCINALPHDRRFKDESWHKWPFNWIHQSFLLRQQWLHNATTNIRGVSQHHENVVSFTARQLMDIFAPSNFVWSNPEVLEETYTSGGMNFVQGFANLLEDIDRKLSNKPPATHDVYKVGENIACTPGKVVYHNRLIELIQYEPTTKTVYQEPILIVPACIMKYYILDLSPENSLVKYLVDKGHTVFMISWKNPTSEDRNLDFEDYRSLGVIDSLDMIARICPKQKVHTIGYCIGGTLLSIAAARMGRDNDMRLQSVTLLAAQTDFEGAGELRLFIDDAQVAYLEDIMWDQGYLSTEQMAGAFQLLRSNDLIWSRIIRQYMMGQRDKAFDLMAWNADATRLPFQMHKQYIRDLVLNNDLAAGRYQAKGRPVNLHQIYAPIFAVGAESDHVAPWDSVYKIHNLVNTEVNFLLTKGGHNAGIISPPGRKHRSYRLSTREPDDRSFTPPETWRILTPEQEGSWWSAWQPWLVSKSGRRVGPPKMGALDQGFPIYGDAPGTYVFQK